MTTKEIIVRCRAKAFDVTERLDFLVDGEDVLAWDDVADHYTRCHSLSDADHARILSAAQEIKKELGIS